MKSGFKRLCGIVLIASALVISGCSGSNADQQTKGGADGKAQPGNGRGARGQGGAPGGRGGRGGQAGGAGQTVSGVKVVPIERIAFQRTIDVSGTLLSQDQVRVSSEVDGIVKDVLIEIGQEVKAGQVIVQIEPRELQFAMDRAESALKQTEAQLGIGEGGEIPPDDQVAAVRTAAANRDDARAQMARAQELNNRGLTSKADLDTAQTRVKVTEAQYQTALDNARSTKASLQDRRAAYELAKKKVADAQIRAPVSGAIAERTAQRGEYIRANTLVGTIVQLSPLKLKSSVQEKNLTLIKPGLPVRFSVESYPNEVFTGRIANISPSIDQTTRTFPIEILVENSSRKLRPGFFSKGQILTKKDENMMAVPEETVVMLAGVASVFTVDKQTREVRQTNIQVGEREGKYLEVTGGLKGDELLAASNLNQLVSGMRVGAAERRGRGGADEPGSIEDKPAPSGGDGKTGAPADGKGGGREGSGGEGRKRGERGGRGQRSGGSDPRGGDNQ
jgi:RND family efflux transporter MFP subunit